MFAWIESHPELGKVDVCINNAGLSTAETLTEGTMESWRQMMDVNVLGMYALHIQFVLDQTFSQPSAYALS